jgi:hypothetical protein
MHPLVLLLLGVLQGYWVEACRRPQVQHFQGFDRRHYCFLLLLVLQLLLECRLHCKQMWGKSAVAWRFVQSSEQLCWSLPLAGRRVFVLPGALDTDVLLACCCCS